MVQLVPLCSFLFVLSQFVPLFSQNINRSADLQNICRSIFQLISPYATWIVFAKMLVTSGPFSAIPKVPIDHRSPDPDLILPLLQRSSSVGRPIVLWKCASWWAPRTSMPPSPSTQCPSSGAPMLCRPHGVGQSDQLGHAESGTIRPFQSFA